MNLVCLVSRQAMPNLLPALMYKPETVYLLSTPEEISCGKHLESLLNKKHFKVVLYDDIAAYDDTQINLRLDEIFEKTNSDITLNVTGGTKPMAFAAYEYFRNKNRPAFYCNTEDKQIIHLLPERRTETLRADLCIEDYLSVYGYKIEEEKSAITNFDYEQFFLLIDQNHHLNEFINFSFSVRKSLSEESNKTVNSKSGNFSFQKTPANFVLSYNKLKTPFKFKFNTKDFLFGDWLEYYVYLKCKLLYPDEIKNGIQYFIYWN